MKVCQRMALVESFLIFTLKRHAALTTKSPIEGIDILSKISDFIQKGPCRFNLDFDIEMGPDLINILKCTQ